MLYPLLLFYEVKVFSNVYSIFLKFPASTSNPMRDDSAVSRLPDLYQPVRVFRGREAVEVQSVLQGQ